MARTPLKGRRAKAEPLAPAETISRPVLAVLAAAAAIPGGFVLVWNLWLWLSGQGYPLRDGVTIWLAGHAALTGQVMSLFKPAGVAAGSFLWSYPPTAALLATPFGWLSAGGAVLAFEAMSAALLLLAVARLGRGWRFTAAVLLCPAALQNFGGNQSAALAAALLILGLAQAERRPWAAGLLLGIASFKPQLGLLVPFYLAGCRNIAALAAAAVTTLALIAVSAWAFSPAVWVDYVTRTLPITSDYLVRLTLPPRDGAPALMSVFALLREAGLPVRLAFDGQILAAAMAALFALWLGANRTLAQDTRLALLLAAGILATPYLWYYDMIPASLAAALLIQDRQRDKFGQGEFLVLGLLWATPGFALLAALVHVPTFAPLLVAAAIIYTLRRPVRPLATDHRVR
jgi:hypothetical protein